MTIITIKTVNHENICCLNSAILMLLLARRKGNLGLLLSRIRELANSDEKYNLLRSESDFDSNESSNSGISSHSATVAVNDNGSNIDDGNDKRAEASKPTTRSKITRSGNYCDSDKVMVNFRELLCFWKEYYLRRGRDRLSLEFSTHIPFKHWLFVVDLLSADVDRPTSLLRSPIQLPRSCYHFPSRVHNSSNNEWINYFRK